MPLSCHVGRLLKTIYMSKFAPSLEEDDQARFGEFNKVWGPKNNPWLGGI